MMTCAKCGKGKGFGCNCEEVQLVGGCCGMNRAEIEIAVLQEAIQNIERIQMSEVQNIDWRIGMQYAIDELENMIEETTEDAE